MSIITTSISTNGEDFKSRAADYKPLLEQLKKLNEQALRGESEKATLKARKRNKLLCDERINRVIDPGSACLEIGALAGYELYRDVPPGAGMRTCIAKVRGRTVMIIANDPSVKGGTYFPITVKKHLRAQQIALENRIPCLYLVDSGGAFLPLQAEVFPDREHFGRIFYNQATMSRLGIPQVSVVLGSCTAGGAYVPAMSDEVIMSRENASVFLGGPPLVQAATGEVVSAAELGGAEAHCKISGVSDHLAENELHALELARQVISDLGSPDDAFPTWRRLSPKGDGLPPRYDANELPGIVGCDLRKSFSTKEVLARILDDSRLDEFKQNYGTSIICGFAQIEGYEVGIVANDGILFSESALKATHFIQLCSQRLIPLLFVQNIVGFMVGKEYEHEGIAKHGAKMVNAVTCARVPKLTLTIGGSYGAGNYGMCGRAFDPRFMYTWPNSRISVMGSEQAANVLSQVRSEKGSSHEQEKQNETFKNEIRQKYDREGSPFYASARLWDDGVISPLDTRRVLSLALSSIGFNPELPSEFGTFRM